MLIGSAGCASAMAVLAGMNYLSQNEIGGETPGWISCACLFIFNSFFALGWLGMSWLYPAEIVPLRIRARANGLSTSANWISNFLVVMITPVCFSSIGYATYIIFAVINAAIIPFVYFLYPETAYRSLEEIDGIFLKSDGWLNVVKVARKEPRRYGKHGELLDEEEKPGNQQIENGGLFPDSTSEKSATDNNVKAWSSRLIGETWDIVEEGQERIRTELNGTSGEG